MAFGVLAHCQATLPVSAKPDQQRRRPQLLVWHVSAELVGKIQPKHCEGVIEIDRDRCLHQSGSRRCLVGQSADVGQPSATSWRCANRSSSASTATSSHVIR